MATNDPLLIYGSYGYTGELIVRQAVDQGLQPVLSGRNAERLRAQAEAFGLEARPADVDAPHELDAALDGMTAVLHCAGPFHRTFKQMTAACLRNGTHYLDITGEIEVFEGCAHLYEAAHKAGTMLMPGVGFDVVPSDCLAAHLKHRLPDAEHLQLAFRGLRGGVSHGTAKTMVENIHKGGAVRRNGKIVQVPLAYASRAIDFGDGKRLSCITIPWGDVSTAFHSTGIPNIEVYVPVPRRAPTLLKLARPFMPLLALPPAQRFLKNRVEAQPPGPSDDKRATGKSLLWGRATNAAGRSVAARLSTPEGYTLTARTSVAIAQRVLGGDVHAGFETPSRAYGADLIMEFDGVERTDTTATEAAAEPS